jgi:protein ImuB
MYACLYAPGNLAVLIECAREFSPLVEEISADAVLVDLHGLQRLLGSPFEIAASIGDRVGIPFNLALAGDPDTAILAARGFPGVTVIEPSREQMALAPLSIHLLPCSAESASILDGWGIRTFGDFAKLPPQGIATRLGKEGTHLLRLARGKGNRQLRPVRDIIQFEQEFELESPLQLLEPLSFLLGRLLNELCGALDASSMATDGITLSLTLENAPSYEACLRLPVPMRDPKVCLKLLQLELSDHPPSAPILKIHLRLNPVKPRTQQHNLFVAVGPQPENLEITLSKLKHLCGAGNVGTPELRNTYRPDAFQINLYTVATGSNTAQSPKDPALVLRRFRPARIAQVVLRDETPLKIWSQNIKGNVLASTGPWRTSGDWWQVESWFCDEWDIALSDGALYRLREDCRVKHWFVEGVYD